MLLNKYSINGLKFNITLQHKMQQIPPLIFTILIFFVGLV